MFLVKVVIYSTYVIRISNIQSYILQHLQSHYWHFSMVWYCSIVHDWCALHGKVEYKLVIHSSQDVDSKLYPPCRLLPVRLQSVKRSGRGPGSHESSALSQQDVSRFENGPAYDLFTVFHPHSADEPARYFPFHLYCDLALAHFV